MLNKVRKFLKNNSPDWLNTEVNKDLLQNLSTKIASTSLPKDIDSAPFSKKGWGDLNESQNEVKPSLNKSNTNNDRQFSTADSSLFPTPGTPHWRRIRQVFQVFFAHV